MTLIFNFSIVAPLLLPPIYIYIYYYYYYI
nr:MAG TPA: hypothetical protein [Caudoviricetes sp.]